MEKEHPLIRDAYSIAQSRHRRFKHPVNLKPYFEHTINVYFQIYQYSKDLNIRIAALLHDGISNEIISYNEIARRFSVEVADMVKDQVIKQKDEMSTQAWQQYFKEKMRRMSREATMIFLAERLETLKLIPGSEYEEAENYMEETFLIIDALPRPLHTEHKLIVDQMLRALKDINTPK